MIRTSVRAAPRGGGVRRLAGASCQRKPNLHFTKPTSGVGGQAAQGCQQQQGAHFRVNWELCGMEESAGRGCRPVKDVQRAGECR